MISSPFVLLVIGLGGLVALGSALVAGREFHTAYRVFSTPTGRVSNLLTDAEGVIELHGTGRPADRTLSGLVTGEACLVCETVVEEYESGQYGGLWNEIDSAVQSVPFLLADDSGSVLVGPRMADVRLVADTERIEVDGGSTPPERVQAYIEDNAGVSCENSRLDLGPFSLPMGSDRRYIERRLRPGGEAYVLGEARSGPGRAGSVNAVVGYGTDAPVFLIADRSPWATGLRTLARGGLYLVPGLLAGGVCLLVLVA
ncbi:E3 ubiquitin ligase [Halalkalicoccus paucihalophilus]|uniref:RING-type E3 ubiquitin transferase n=1 Tax=Halalkalicoccus paucihalophilus TaxID=1008153 RepID=A0A151AFB3_9EURY|nr:GIDE domain-containing protein [Halalkalicoccus paucihalophilus]KYH26366.1 E3 ubiquitin ligase [Halalkalicoccus paucihalophilus]